jgi:hypothetical protein
LLESVELLLNALWRGEWGLARAALLHVRAHPQAARRLILGLKNVIRNGSRAD